MQYIQFLLKGEYQRLSCNLYSQRGYPPINMYVQKYMLSVIRFYHIDLYSSTKLYKHGTTKDFSKQRYNTPYACNVI